MIGRTLDHSAEDGWPEHCKQGWFAAEFDSHAATVRLQGDTLAVLLELVDETKRRSLAITEITREVFDHPALHDAFASWVRTFKDGQGLLQFEGFPVRDRPLDDIWRMYWGVGTHFGIGVSQNTQGQMLGTVTVQPGMTGGRVYGSSAPAPLHSDRIDILSLLCINKARQGGENVFVSALKVWELMEQERPDLLQRLMRGYPQQRMGEQPEGCAPVTPYRVPVFGEVGGLRSAYFGGNASRAYQQQQFAEIFTDEDREALDYLGSMLQRPELALNQTLEPGYAVFINNREMLHSRTSFQDGDGPGEKRLLLRMWLEGRPRRPIPQDMHVIHNPSGELGILTKVPIAAAAD